MLGINININGLSTDKIAALRATCDIGACRGSGCADDGGLGYDIVQLRSIRLGNKRRDSVLDYTRGIYYHRHRLYTTTDTDMYDHVAIGLSASPRLP